MKEHMWHYDIEVISKGYSEEDNYIKCIYCDTAFEKGRIYRFEDELYDVHGMIKQHMVSDHGSSCQALLSHKHSLYGLTEIQLKVLTLLSQGYSDKEISESLVITQSTVRNHRFKLREKEKQAKMLLGLMTAVKKHSEMVIDHSDQGIISEVHDQATMIDLRYNITDKDREKVLKNYFDEHGALTHFPPKAKKKIIVLREIMKVFKTNVDYTEKDINMYIKRIYEDYVTIRRALIEYGYLTRTRDGRIYKVTE